MSVETRFVVVRNNVEIKIFVEKKEADEYDKLLDSADSLSQLLKEGPVKLSEEQIDDLGHYLALNKDKILEAFKLKKTPLAKSPKTQDEID